MTNNSPLCTCIITCYNQEEYIYETLDSLLNQNYPNIQLILVDDGSVKFNREKVCKYIESNRKENIKDYIVHVNPKNIGAIKTYNLALDWAEGKYINIFDGDDEYVGRSMLGKVIDYFEKLPEDIYILVTQMMMCGETFDKKKYLYCDNNYMESLSKESAKNQAIAFYDRMYAPKGSTFFKKILYDKIGKYDESYEIIDDWSFLLKAFSNGYKFVYYDLLTANHRHGGISSNEAVTPRRIKFLYEQWLTMKIFCIPQLNTIPEKRKRDLLTMYNNYYTLYAKSAEISPCDLPDDEKIDINQLHQNNEKQNNNLCFLKLCLPSQSAERIFAIYKLFRFSKTLDLTGGFIIIFAFILDLFHTSSTAFLLTMVGCAIITLSLSIRMIRCFFVKKYPGSDYLNLLKYK